MAGQPRRGRTRYLTTVALIIALGVILCLAGLLGIIGNLTSGTSLSWGGAAVELAFLAIGVLLLAEALRRDRRRRHGLYSQAASALAPVRRLRRALILHSPLLPTLVTLVWTGLAIASVVSAVQFHGQSSVSAYTQSSGLRRDAIVSGVHNIPHPSPVGSSTFDTAEVKVFLASPVAGQLTTTVRVPYRVSARRGQFIQVLVDPRQPGYSEVPGAPYVTAGQWIAPAVAAVVEVGFAALFGWWTLLVGRAWRPLRALYRMAAGHTGAKQAVP